MRLDEAMALSLRNSHIEGFSLVVQVLSAGMQLLDLFGHPSWRWLEWTLR